MKSDKNQRLVYYNDELCDDFGDLGLNRPDLPPDYKYIRTGIGRFFSFLFYYLFAFPILWIMCKFYGVKVKGRKKLRALKKVGYFLYGNHTLWIDAITPAVMIARPKRANIVGYTDAMTIPVAKSLLRPLGYLPITDKLADLKRFNKAVDYLIEHKQCIAIYPEAHIWPYYTGIRKFKFTSFRYPAKLSAPVVPFCTTYRKSRFSKKPKMTINIGDPIYPDSALSVNENTAMLAQKTYDYMLKCSRELPNYEYIRYVKNEEKTESPEE